MATRMTIAQLVADPILEAAYAWLCHRRQAWPPATDVWRVRQHWPQEKARMQAELEAGTYEFGLLHRITRPDGEAMDLWSARDAVVLKALALVLPESLPLSTHCTHLKGHGGLKYAVRHVLEQVPSARFVLKTDVKSYYASIDHRRLLERLAVHLPDQRVLTLIGQSLRRRAERGGLYWEYGQGLALGSPLSPLLGAFVLTALDEALARLQVSYVRYMDDLLVLAPTRWRLRQAVKVVNQGLAALGLEKHPDKTFIGRVEHGFDWLGYHVCPGQVTVAPQTLAHGAARLHRLYEQQRGKPALASALEAYVRRWRQWVVSGLQAWLTPRDTRAAGCAASPAATALPSRWPAT